MSTRIPLLAALLLALSALAGRALAADGVIEINQASAEAGGVTATDTSGFPVTIDVSGSYVLTGNLAVDDPNLDGIEVTADGVTLDLNGFEISGPVTCTGLGSAVSCGPGTGGGINADGRARVTVRNGRVRGFGSYGVFVGNRGQLRHLVAESNGFVGLQAMSDAIVSDCIARANASGGIGVLSIATITRSTSSSNGGHGIAASEAASILGNVAYDNGSNGIQCQLACVVRDNVARFNESGGIAITEGVVSDNASLWNGTTGISAGAGSTIQRNTSRGNTGFGLWLSNAAYRGNTVSGNTGGTVNGGINMLANSCNGATTCP